MPAARPAGRAGAAAPAEASSGRPRTYEQLVAEANRALENGNTAKAQKFVDEALRLQPSGVAAVTASAYLLLDKRKPLAAVGEFKRALNNSPNFPQALFGVGEAYRSAGDTAQAIDAYKKYLAAAPGGEDAPAARRQLRELESQPARPSHSTTTTVPDPGSAPPPVPTPAPRPELNPLRVPSSTGNGHRRVDEVGEHLDDVDDRLHGRGALDLSDERCGHVAARV